MNIRLLLITVSLISSASSAMDRKMADSLAMLAQQAYAAGDHQRSLQLYDSVNTVYSSAGLLYNIGNCYFKLQNVPLAILYYERALKLSPNR